MNDNYPHHVPAPNLTMKDECGEANVSAEKNPCYLPEKADDTDKSICSDVNKSAADESGNGTVFVKMKGKVINVDNLLGCILTCGSQRLSSVMYCVVRTVLIGRKCGVCGA